MLFSATLSKYPIMTVKAFHPVVGGHKCQTCGVLIDSIDAVVFHQCTTTILASRAGCVHRGKELRREECPSCTTYVELKIFECEKHKECCIDKTVEGVMSCSGCNDFEAKREIATRSVTLIPPTQSNPSFIYEKGSDVEYVSLAQRGRDIQKLVSMLPVSTSRIIGIARSGLAVATDVAMLMHRPLSSFDQQTGTLTDLGRGWRLTGHVQDTGPVVIIDDTVMTGNSFKQVLPILREVHPTAVSAAIYVNPAAEIKPEIWVRDLKHPHILEWNLFNSVMTPQCAFDMDGVLCEDCTPEEDDDGPRYAEFLRDVRPKFYVRRVPLSLVVTARASKYEKQTRDWLARHGFSIEQLVMGPWKNPVERSRADIAQFKSDAFKKFSAQKRLLKPPMFVESDPSQAERIARLSGGVVVCPTSERCYSYVK